MNFLDLVAKRYSVRRYDSRKPDRQSIYRCLEAARLAPSAVNSQPWHFVVADDEEKVRALGRAAAPAGAMNRFAHGAPVIAALVVEKPNLISRLGSFLKDKAYYLLDIGIAAEHFCLQAAEEGLGSCIIGWFDEKGVKESLDIPASKRVALLISLGYPAESGRNGELDEPSDGPAKKRKSIEEMSSFNSYGSGGQA
ncbi:MAG TPA: NAD(P)H nitroreductase [Sediminispirochaeta sp.]|nr:NAD(P)H nitroreductase [Sediminispirochaeta sp.]